MKSSQFLGENFVEDAHSVHQDHEVQMAREELYHSAEYALRLHKLLRNVDEQQGLEGWVSSKITLASDYLKTVLEYMEYELMTAANQQTMLPIAENMQQGVAEGFDNPYKEIDLNAWHIMASDHSPIAINFPSEYDAKSFYNGHGYGNTVKIKHGTQVRRDPYLKYNPSVINWPEYSKGVAEDMSRRVAIGPDGQVTGGYQPSTSGEPVATQPKSPEEIEFDKKQADWQKQKQENLYQQKLNNYMRGDNRGAGFGFQPRPEDIEKANAARSKLGINEMSAGSVATVVNPTPKNKAKTGTLFGGTYKQPKAKK